MNKYLSVELLSWSIWCFHIISHCFYYLSCCSVATLLSRYTIGKIPKAFKHIPSMQHWEEVLYVTEPENWSPNAMYQATRIFASNLGAKKAERFYRLVLLARVREDIRKNKRLHFALYQSLKKALYKPAAFFKGILFPLCEVYYLIYISFTLWCSLTSHWMVIWYFIRFCFVRFYP